MKYAWVVVALLWVAGLLNYLDRQVIFSLFPLIRHDLGLTDAQLGWISSSFLWVYALASPLCGYAADRLGRVRLIVASLGLWSIVTFFTGRTNTFGQLLTTRAAMGLSEAFYLPAALALIAQHHNEATRGRATGLHYSGIYAGIVIGGAGGGWIGENYGWRFGFTILGIAGVIYSLVLAASLEEKPSATSRAAATSFRHSMAALLRMRAVWVLIFVFVATSAANWLVYTWMPLYLFDRFQLSLTRAGFLATFWIQAGSVAGILLGGAVADWWSKRDARGRVWLQAIGLFAAAPFLFLSGFTASSTLVAAGLLMFGIGRGIFDANAMPVLCLLAPEHLRSTGFGLLNFVGVLAGGTMATAAGYLKASVGLGQLVQAGGFFVLLAAGALMVMAREANAERV